MLFLIMIPYFIKNKANYYLRKSSYAKAPENQVKFQHTKGIKNARRKRKIASYW